MSIKVAYLLGSLNRGGTETLLLDVFRNALKNKLDAIGIYRKTGVFEKEFNDSGVSMYKLSVGTNPINYFLKLRKLLSSNNITIVHAQQPLDALYARIACMGTGIKVVLTFHGYDYTDKGFGLRLLRYIIQRTDMNLYVSNVQRQYYIQKYTLKPLKQAVLYNGISFDKLKGKTFLSTIRQELRLDDEKLLIGTVGNFNDVRDQYTICRFLVLLDKQGVDFHFIFAGKRVIGQEQLYDRCVEYCNTNGISAKVSFLGVRNDVPDILKQLDAFVYSTDHDTFGIAVVEAMAVGVPVFVNDWEVIAEITDNGKYASLYKSKDENELLREFMLFLLNKEECQTKANIAVLFVKQRYSIEKHIEELKKVYSSLL